MTKADLYAIAPLLQTFVICLGIYQAERAIISRIVRLSERLDEVERRLLGPRAPDPMDLSYRGPERPK